MKTQYPKTPRAAKESHFRSDAKKGEKDFTSKKLGENPTDEQVDDAIFNLIGIKDHINKPKREMSP